MNKEGKYKKAEQVVILQQYMSISYLQRLLRIGYNEAFRIAEELQRNGIIARVKNSHEWDVLELPKSNNKKLQTDALQCPECEQNQESGMNFCAFCGRQLWHR